MLETSRSSSSANGKLMASVSSGVISAAQLISRSFTLANGKEQIQHQRSVPSYSLPSLDEADDPAHNTCKLRRREPQYPCCTSVNEFERRSNLGATLAHVWLLLGKPSKHYVGHADKVSAFSGACRDLSLQQAEHVRCLLLRSSAIHFKELLEFVPSACDCASIGSRTQPHALFPIDNNVPGGDGTDKERVRRSVSTLEQMSATSSVHSITPVQGLKPESTGITHSGSRRSVLNSFLSKRISRSANAESSDRPHEPAFTNNGGKRMWSRAVKSNGGSGQALKATGSLPPGKTMRV